MARLSFAVLCVTVPASLATLSCGGGGGARGDGGCAIASPAAGCAAASPYASRCFGDGRDCSNARSCEKSAYAYFAVRMFVDNSIAAAEKDSIDHCSLSISDSTGTPVVKYPLPLVSDGTGTVLSGCAPGQTLRVIGWLSYTSCCAAGDSRLFRLTAESSDGTLVAGAEATAACEPIGSRTAGFEVPVDLSAN
jgi:hypothetical protein